MCFFLVIFLNFQLVFCAWTTIFSDGFGASSTTQSRWSTTLDWPSTSNCGASHGSLAMKLAFSSVGCPRSWYMNYIGPYSTTISSYTRYRVSFYWKAGSNSDPDCEQPDSGENMAVKLQTSSTTTIYTMAYSSQSSWSSFSYDFSYSGSWRLYFNQPTCSMVDGDAYAIDNMYFYRCSSASIGDECLDFYTVNTYQGYQKDGYYYYFNSGSYDFYAARSLCKSIHPAMDLFVPTSSALKTLMYDTIKGSADSWAGGYNMWEMDGDVENTDHYKDFTGSDFPFSISTTNNKYDCIYMDEGTGDFVHSQCTGTKGVICQLLLTEEGSSYPAEPYFNVIYQSSGPDYCNFGLANCPDYYKKCNGIVESDGSVCSSHGSCLFDSDNNIPYCDCNDNYFGVDCDVTLCNGVYSNSSSICYTHGSCSVYEECQCSDNYFGTDCSVTKCNGVYSNSSSICSTHGSCLVYNECQCNDNYFGSDCSVTSCNNVLSNTSEICYTHGTCTTYEECQCSNNYFGSDCNVTSCNDIYSNESSICTTHGSCSVYDECQCVENYYGSDCSVTSCNDVFSNSSDICTIHGTCTIYEECLCVDNYYGSDCSVTSCNDVFSNSSSICSTHGSCSVFDECQCVDNYFGTDCSVTKCNDVYSNSSSICSTHGSCSVFEECQCDALVIFSECLSSLTSYRGNNGMTISCQCTAALSAISGVWGVGPFTDDSRPCRAAKYLGLLDGSDEGNIKITIAPGESSYSSGFANGVGTSSYLIWPGSYLVEEEQASSTGSYFGADCSVTTCNEIYSNSSEICTTHGSCSVFEECQCEDNYHGIDCRVTSCNDVYSNESLICSAHGSCTVFEECQCVDNYFGTNCNVTLCNNIFSNTSEICSTHGSCGVYEECQCETEDEVNFSECPTGLTGYRGNNGLTISCRCRASSTISGSVYGIGPFADISKPCRAAKFSGFLNASDEGNVKITIAPGESSYSSGIANEVSAYSWGSWSYSFTLEEIVPTGSYFGDDCSVTTCNEIYSNSSEICNTHGSCSVFEECQCEDNYYGSDCSMTSCNNVYSNESSICTTHGSCSVYNECECLDNYYGQDCDVTLCNEVYSNSSSICYTHGSCTIFEECQCFNNYFGPDCNVTLCNNVFSNSSQICSTHGTCDVYEECQCGTEDTLSECPNNVVDNRGNNGMTISCQCTSTLSAIGTVYGSQPFTDDSQICRAAKFLGLLDGSDEGNIKITIAPGESSYSGGIANGVETNDDGIWPGSYLMEEYVSSGSYFGPDCNITLCNNIFSNTSEICSTHGSCSVFEECQCDTQVTYSDCPTGVTEYRGNNGLTISCRCTPALTVSGSVYGNGIPVFADISKPCRAAKFMGLLDESDEGLIKITIAGGESSYSSGSANGVSAYSWGSWSYSFSLSSQALSGSYFGDDCSTTTCNNIFSNTSEICTTHGSCSVYEECQCEDNYYGIDCSITKCNNVFSNSSSICSTHGSCIVDECQCVDNYFGSDCSVTLCNNIYSNTSEICSTHGSCTIFEECQCFDNYFGSDCSVTSCNNVFSNTSEICYTHGSCSVFEECQCVDNYFGSDCNVTSCNSVFSNSSSICSTHGSCSVFEECQCDTRVTYSDCPTGVTEYRGNNGLTISCRCTPALTLSGSIYGVGPFADFSKPCRAAKFMGLLDESDEGLIKITIAGGESSFSSGSANGVSAYSLGSFPYSFSLSSQALSGSYFGDDCSTTTCNNIFSNTSEICTTHGSCSVYEECQCEDNYYGIDCSITKCNNVFSNSSSICSTHGSCIVDECQCVDNYFGSDCSVTLCNNVYSNTSEICSTHGSCTIFEECQCFDNYFGSDCSVTSCNNVFSNTSEICYTHGSCTIFEECQCVNNYFGSDCNVTLCNNVFSNSSSICSTHGSCSVFEECQCDTRVTYSDCPTGVTEYRGNNGLTISCRCTPALTLSGSIYGVGPFADFSKPCRAAKFMGLLDESDEGLIKITIAGGESSFSSGFANGVSAYSLGSFPYSFSLSSQALSGSYFGADCSVTTCNEIYSNSSEICTTHGSCSVFEECQCEDNYYDIDCSVTNCNDVFSNTSEICATHGSCTIFEECQCSQNYYGNDCNITTCNNIFSNTSEICSTHGTCTVYEECVCDEEYYGEVCDYTTCNNMQSNHSDVCGGHGTCCIHEECQCDENYYGSHCVITLCNDMYSNSSGICSSHGSCTFFEECQCDENYFGEDCNITLCNNIYSNSSSICSTHGFCNVFEECQCDDNYCGADCSVTKCNDIYSNKTDICSTHGRCQVFEKCQCDENYFGVDCNITTCNNIFSNSSSICYTHGSCNVFEECQCYDDYYGEDCNITTCNNVFSNSSSICSTHGFCNVFEECQCDDNYYGIDCSVTKCNDIFSNKTDICSTHGSCTIFEECQCNENYYGNNCNVTICNDIFSNYSEICSTHGTCTVYENCVCDDLYYGRDCFHTFCNNMQSNHSDVCSGHGSCCVHEECQCFDNYYGELCSINLCNDVYSNSSDICSTHGDCISYEECRCFENYYGEDCNVTICNDIFSNESSVCQTRGICSIFEKCECDINYFGEDCSVTLCNDIFSNYSDQVCSNRGSCDVFEKCQCFENYFGEDCNVSTCDGVFSNISTSSCHSHGVCVDFNNCSCEEIYYGTSCQFCQNVFCSNNGNCSIDELYPFSPKCDCRSTHDGFNCEFVICNGVSSRGNDVCRYRGDCISHDSCLCDPNFFGTDCEYCNRSHCHDSGDCSRNMTFPYLTYCDCETGYHGYVCDKHGCFNISFEDPTVCRGDGICVSPDNCSCFEGFSGYNCKSDHCYNFDLEKFCSGHGLCNVATDSCDCENEYTGKTCELWYCRGEIWNDTQVVCSGYGNCSRSETCECNDGYYDGEDLPCSHWNCFQTARNESTKICRLGGACISPDVCQCFDEYHGNECQFCNQSVCNNHGTCTRSSTFPWEDICSCDDGYTKSRCNESSCHSIDHDDPVVCRKRGNCISPNKCLCDPNYFGMECEYCNRTECSDHGNCSRSEVYPFSTICGCDIGFYGSNCEDHKCYQHHYLSEEYVCGGKGRCTGPDSCKCGDHFSGDDCMECDNNFFCSGNGNCSRKDLHPWNPQCKCKDGYISDSCEHTVCYSYSTMTPKLICSGIGECVLPNNCFCPNTHVGDECEYSLCFGIPENDTSLVCSNRGECKDFNTCLCNKDFYFGDDCSVTKCYDVFSNDTSTVCSSNGDCTDLNTCDCNHEFDSLGKPKWGGDRCEVMLCDGVFFSDENVCSKQGECNNHHCDCEEEWKGPSCEFEKMSKCFGIWQNSEEVCSGNGDCLFPDDCNCTNENYGGEKCNIEKCYGIIKDEDEVCSGHGECDPGTFSCINCYGSYSGEKCEIPNCFKIPATNSKVCSGKGNCTAPDICVCENGFGGGIIEDCSSFNCFGILNENSKVCSSHGKCDQPDICSCETGYSGEECSIPSCFEVFSKIQDGTTINSNNQTISVYVDNPKVCSGHGLCTKYDSCFCFNDYFGKDCSDPLCYEKLSSSMKVCSGHGECKSPQKCVCKDGYFGDTCSLFKCNGVKMNDPKVCSSHGSCRSKESCVCKPGYFGVRCSEYLCFGINSTDLGTVCSGHGNCDAPKSCSCEINYDEEEECNVWKCFEHYQSSKDVCSKHGECSSHNNCSCDENWIGDECEIPVCYSIPSTNITSCSNHGKCVDENTCSCTPSFADGKDCSSCAPSFKGENCNISYCDDDFTCNSRGKCNEHFQCDCEGHFSSPFCEHCEDEYYGENCDFQCNDTKDCLDHGVCLNKGCSCFDDDVRGHFITSGDSQAQCDLCKEGWHGDNCNIFLSLEFQFSDEYDRVVGTFNKPQRKMDSLNCEKFIHTHDISQKIGAHSLCRWEEVYEEVEDVEDEEYLHQHHDFEIILGNNPSLKPGDKIRLDVHYDFSTDVKYLLVDILPPKNPKPPVAILSSEPEIGQCDLIILDASKSFAYDGKMLKDFSYKIISGCNISAIQEYMDNTTSSNNNEENIYKNLKIIIPLDMTISGCEYKFSLTVTSSFDLISEPDIITIFKKDEVVPQAKINGELFRNFVFSNPIFSIEGDAYACGKVQDPQKFIFSWKQISGIVVFPTQTNNDQRIIFRPIDFPKVMKSDYTYEFTVSPKYNTSIKSTKQVTFTTIPIPLVSILEGGDREVSNSSEVIIDGSSSYDPNIDERLGKNGLIYVWTCKNLQNGATCKSKFPKDLRNSDILKIPGGSFEAGEYEIFLEVRSEDRSSKTSIILKYRNLELPFVRIGGIPAVINPNTLMVFYGTAIALDGSPMFSGELQWRINNEIPDSNVVFTPSDQSILGVKPNVFLPGSTYKFELTYFYEDESKKTDEFGNVLKHKVSSSVSTYINTPPQPGIFHIEPSIGFEFTTIFTFRCLFWYDEHVPLKYSFTFIDPETQTEVMLMSASESEERETAIPVIGNITVIATIQDSLGSEMRIEKIVSVTEMEVSSSSINETIYFFIDQAQNSQTYPACFDFMMKASKLFSKVAQELNDVEIYTYTGLLQETFVYCKEVDQFRIASKESVNQEVSVLKDRSSDLNGNTVETLSDDEKDLQLKNTIGDIEVLVNLPADLMDLSNIQLMGDVFSNAFDIHNKLHSLNDTNNNSTTTNNNNNEEEDKSSNPCDGKNGTTAFAAHMMSLLENLMSSLASHTVVGANSTNVKTEGFEMTAQKVYPDKLDDSTIETGNISISLNSELAASSDDDDGDGDGSPMDIMLNVFSSPPVNTGQNISSPVFSLSVGSGASGKKKKVANLTEPIIFTMPASLEDIEVETNPRLKGRRPTCRYFNNKTLSWRSDGCKVIQSTPHNITCACDHLTDFSSVVDYGEPELNTIGADDYKNISKLSVDNLTAVYFVLGLMILYFIGCIISNTIHLVRRKINLLIKRIDRLDLGPEIGMIIVPLSLFLKIIVYEYRIKQKEKLEQQLQKKKNNDNKALIKDYILEYIFSNIWISIILERRDGLTRSQILTIMYCLLLSISLSNALTYGQGQANIVQMVVAAVASSLIVMPVTILTILFRFIGRRVEDKVYEDEDEDDEIVGIHSGDLENGIIDLESSNNKSSSSFGYILLLCFGVDEMIVGIKRILENSRFIGVLSIFVLFSVLVLYLIVILFLDFASLFVLTWIGEYGCILFSVLGIVMLIYFIVIVYWYQKTKHYIHKMTGCDKIRKTRKQEKNKKDFGVWVSLKFQIIHIFLITVLFGICLVVIGICVYLHINSDHLRYMITIETGCVLIMGLEIYWLYRLIIPPTILKKKKKQKKKKKGNGKLPHFCGYFLYIIAYSGIIVMSYYVVLYGIKFDSNPNLQTNHVLGSTSADWLLGTFSAVGNSVGVNAPIKYVLKTVLFYIITLVFTRALTL